MSEKQYLNKPILPTTCIEGLSLSHLEQCVRLLHRNNLRSKASVNLFTCQTDQLTVYYVLVIWSLETALPLLKNKIAVVTGASSGIGRAIGLNLARNGAHVFLTGRDEERLEEAASTIG